MPWKGYILKTRLLYRKRLLMKISYIIHIEEFTPEVRNTKEELKNHNDIPNVSDATKDLNEDGLTVLVPKQ